jgi:hypothetical protein
MGPEETQIRDMYIVNDWVMLNFYGFVASKHGLDGFHVHLKV